MLNKIYSDEVTVKDIFLFRIFWYIVEKRNDNSGIIVAIASNNFESFTEKS